MRPASTPLSGGRWVPFIETWAFQEVDLSAASFAMHIRLTPDAPGDPLVGLGLVGVTPSEQGIAVLYAGTATIAAHLAAGRMLPDEVPEGAVDSDNLLLSQLRVRINETVMEALPFPGERGDDNVLAWDLHVTVPGSLKQVWAAGPFSVIAGSTQ